MSREPAQVVGRINIRPCRLGLVFKPELAILCRAVEHATTAWGGMYFPFLSPDEERSARSLATVLSVDALHALDEESLSTNLSELPGFRWRVGLRSNPFEAEEGLPTTRILGPDWLLDLTHDTTFVLPRWEPSDPLEKLFTVWFGRYDSSSYGLNLAERFRTLAEEIEVDPAAAVPDVADRLTPLDLTALEIAYAGDIGSPSFIVLNSQSPSDLIAFWNMRAWGQPVFPWPRGYDDRLLPAAESWLRLMINTGRLGRSQSGTGEDLGHFIRVVTKPREKIPGPLAQLLRQHALNVSSGPPYRPKGWTGSHPMTTDFSQSFSLTLAAGDRRAMVPIPSINASSSRRRTVKGIVAAQIDINWEAGLGPAWTFSLPNVRDLADLKASYDNFPEAFHRPTHRGYAIGIDANADQVTIAPVSPETVFKRIMDGPGWNCQQRENGRFTSQLVERFGGAANTAGNQPAIGAVLVKAAGSPKGLPLPALIQTAKNHQGAWPAPLGDRKTYPKWVTYELLRRKLLLPGHRVKCPSCATEVTLSPEDLATDLTCEMCSEAFPLGFALGVRDSPKNDWVYRLAGNIPVERIREAMPVMAAISMFSVLSDTVHPHIIGLEVFGPHGKSEVDLTIAFDDHGITVVIIGEVKSYRDSIDANDLANLRRIQEHLRHKGIECLLLVATKRDEFSPEEQQTLRDFCAELPDMVHPRVSIVPVAPIVMSGRELSAPPFTKLHPEMWGTIGGWTGIIDLAAESCRRNLGDFKASYRPGIGYGPGSWRLIWPESQGGPVSESGPVD